VWEREIERCGRERLSGDGSKGERVIESSEGENKNEAF
jgi:hypothetical protein